MSEFRQLTPTMFASPQIGLEQVHQAKAQGITLIINNRPDGESPSEPQGAEIEQAAKAAGIAYLAIPVTHSGFSESQIAAMREGIDYAGGAVLAYCRSGTRSTLLWALAQAQSGIELGEIATAANSAGYDLTPIQPLLDMLADQAKQ